MFGIGIKMRTKLIKMRGKVILIAIFDDNFLK